MAIAALVALSLLPGPLHPPALRAADPIADYGNLLARSVQENGIDYGVLAEGRAALDGYVEWLGSASPGATDADRMAFWINAHNALVLREILDRKTGTPGGRTWRVAGRDVTVAQVGDDVLKEFREPLVRFALHDGARSSPPLAAVPYAGDGLREALVQQARAYLGDTTQNLFEYAQLRAELSMLFLRHREEFEAGREGPVPPLQLFLADCLPAKKDAEARSLRSTRWSISYRPWDGSLDEVPPARGLSRLWIPYVLTALLLLSLGFRAFRALLRQRGEPPPAPAPPHPPGG